MGELGPRLCVCWQVSYQFHQNLVELTW